MGSLGVPMGSQNRQICIHRGGGVTPPFFVSTLVVSRHSAVPKFSKIVLVIPKKDFLLKKIRRFWPKKKRSSLFLPPKKFSPNIPQKKKFLSEKVPPQKNFCHLNAKRDTPYLTFQNTPVFPAIPPVTPPPRGMAENIRGRDKKIEVTPPPVTTGWILVEIGGKSKNFWDNTFCGKFLKNVRCRHGTWSGDWHGLVVKNRVPGGRFQVDILRNMTFMCIQFVIFGLAKKWHFSPKCCVYCFQTNSR